MEMVDYNTKLFKNIFPDYETFSNWYRSIPLSVYGGIYCPNQITFTLIAYEYNDSHVAYSVESFKEHFAIDLYNYFKEFEATTEMINQLMELTDEEIAVSGELITNFADIPEAESSTDAESVNFISNQQKNISRKGTLQVKREQLSNKRAFTVKAFLNRFRHLFIRVASPAYTFVVKEETEE